MRLRTQSTSRSDGDRSTTAEVAEDAKAVYQQREGRIEVSVAKT